MLPKCHPPTGHSVRCGLPAPVRNTTTKQVAFNTRHAHQHTSFFIVLVHNDFGLGVPDGVSKATELVALDLFASGWSSRCMLQHRADLPSTKYSWLMHSNKLWEIPAAGPQLVNSAPSCHSLHETCIPLHNQSSPHAMVTPHFPPVTRSMNRNKL